VHQLTWRRKTISCGPAHADAITSTTYTIRGLDEKRTYYFQIYGGDDTQGSDFDVNFFNLQVTTTILRTFPTASHQ